MATGCDSTASTPSVRLREASSSLLSLEENRTKRMLRRTHTISLVLSTQKGFACSSRPPHHEREVTLLIYQHLSAIIEHAPLETLAARTVLPMLSDAGRVLWSGHLRYRRAFSCSAVSNLQRTGPPGDARPALCKIRRTGRTINCPLSVSTSWRVPVLGGLRADAPNTTLKKFEKGKTVEKKIEREGSDSERERNNQSALQRPLAQN